VISDLVALLVWFAQGIIVAFIGFVIFDRIWRRESRKSAEGKDRDPGDGPT